MNNNKTTASASAKGGIGFVGLLTIVFIVLKLTNVIAWSWVWVLAPLWISAILSVVLVVLFVVFVVLAVNKMVE